MTLTGRVLQEDLAAAVKALTRLTPARPRLPITDSVLITGTGGTLTVEATDLTTHVVRTLGAQDADGALAVPARPLARLLQPLAPGPLTLKAKGRELTIKDGQERTVTLTGTEAGDFPPLQDIKGHVTRALRLDARTLRRSLQRVLISAARDDVRPVLHTVNLVLNGSLALTSADGFRLSRDTLDAETKGPKTEVNLALETAAELVRCLEHDGDVMIEASDTVTRFHLPGRTGNPNITLNGLNTQSTFPNYERALESSGIGEPAEARLSVDVTALRREVEAAHTLARDASGIVRFHAEPNHLRLSTKAEERGTYEATLSAEFEGEASRVALNTKYLRDLLAVIGSERVTLELRGPARPISISDGETPYQHVITPMIVQW